MFISVVVDKSKFIQQVLRFWVGVICLYKAVECVIHISTPLIGIVLVL